MPKSKKGAFKTEIEAFIQQLRPALQSDGGDLELIEVDEKAGMVKIQFFGACSHCGIADITLKHYLEKQLISKFPEIREMIAA